MYTVTGDTTHPYLTIIHTRTHTHNWHKQMSGTCVKPLRYTNRNVTLNASKFSTRCWADFVQTFKTWFSLGWYVFHGTMLLKSLQRKALWKLKYSISNTSTILCISNFEGTVLTPHASMETFLSLKQISFPYSLCESDEILWILNCTCANSAHV